MRILALSSHPDLIVDTLRLGSDTILVREPDLEVSDWPEADWVVSFGYRKIIPAPVINHFKGKIINIHISLLPYNRGAAPNFWSWFDDTSKGVTIHRVSPEIDKGEVLAQMLLEQAFFRDAMTLASTYEDLLIAASGLFERSWPLILENKLPPFIDRFVFPGLHKKPGTYHRAGQEKKFMVRLGGYDVPVVDVMQLGRCHRGHFVK